MRIETQDNDNSIHAQKEFSFCFSPKVSFSCKKIFVFSNWRISKEPIFLHIKSVNLHLLLRLVIRYKYLEIHKFVNTWYSFKAINQDFPDT